MERTGPAARRSSARRWAALAPQHHRGFNPRIVSFGTACWPQARQARPRGRAACSPRGASCAPPDLARDGRWCYTGSSFWKNTPRGSCAARGIGHRAGLPWRRDSCARTRPPPGPIEPKGVAGLSLLRGCSPDRSRAGYERSGRRAGGGIRSPRPGCAGGRTPSGGGRSRREVEPSVCRRRPGGPGGKGARPG